MLFKTVAFLALVAFATIVHAQDEVEEIKPAEVKAQEDDEVHAAPEKLETRYGGGSYKGNRGGERGGKNNKGEEEEEGKLEGGRGERGRGEGNGRGAGVLGNVNRGQNIEGSEVRLSKQRVTNKVVPGVVRVRPTTRTYSRRQRVVKSRKNEYFQQNSASVVVQNNVVKKTSIHVNTDTTVHVPKTVKTFVKKHNTKYVINTQPIKTYVNIERKQDIFKPELKNIVVYKNSENVQKNRLHTIVRHKSAYERLKTIWEPTHNEGTRVYGNPLDAMRINNNALDQGQGNRLGGGGYNGRNGGNGGNKRYNGKSLNYRASEVVIEEDAKPAEETKEE